ncbi:MAG: spermidine/putrescine ABC transporter ATP-binding protein [Treponema sp. CETP13]|nr:MAG: spermidine/putrescine ABC transporter ATP-binding protein [Treponema sp. CETP13]
MKGSTVSIKGVSKHFGSFHALKDAEIMINEGEFFSLLGPSGCGKTTLLRIIAGFENPDDGVVLIDDKDVVSFPANKRPTNTVFQNYALFPHLSVYENVAFSLRLRKVEKKELDRKVKEYVHLVDLDAHMHKKISQLSGGQRQRVAIARALINEPKVLLLDEPLSALDAKLRQNLLIELDDLHDKIGITFIYVTHDQAEALSVSDRIAVMNAGKVLQVGTPFEIYENPATAFVAKFIGETNLFLATVEKCMTVEKVLENADEDADDNFTETDEFLCEIKINKLPGLVQVSDYERTEPGQQICYTVRPEKVHISLDPPPEDRMDLNVYKGVVDEPVYSGFQTKFYIRLDNGTKIKVFKQHSTYLDDGPEIEWKDHVYVYWSAHDGYIVEDVDE